ncbi:unnamed protein product [Chrysodeixis includens]|uniref:Alpha N-terminal protein methyltransferase 1 n=1 Tax=Chrysodeixis includens TaxID=689277 RepID=A0A9P0BNP0_CHRIL|nr:unnamed protein product [Chrysodeixis includens]
MTESGFYKKAANYWANIPPTIDGVLAGFGYISETDIASSKVFLSEILALENPPSTNHALDCGAGIGRVTKYVLLPRFEKVDLVEQDEKFINSAQQFVGKDKDRIESLYKIGLQYFKPEKKYDLIWCQWVIGHIKDYDLIDVLERCRVSLNDNGVIIIKENVTTSKTIDYDEDDSSVTRPMALLETLFREAKLKIIKQVIQEGFPEGLYPVYTFALVPVDK